MLDHDTDLLPQVAPKRSMIETQINRQAQEVQAAMVIAKRFPRDQIEAVNRILQCCKRKSLAEQAIYTYPRGGTQVEGPSIRLAEAMAQNWGNIDFGIIELSQDTVMGESSVMAYAQDLETNTRQVKIFTVPHFRQAKGEKKRLEDPRDIYEMVANQGARRLRSCILGIIPGDVTDEAVAQCNKTISSGSSEPLVDRLRKMVAAFADFGVTKEMIEKNLQHNLEACNEQELIKLRKIYSSMKDGMSKREDYFEVNAVTTTTVSKPKHAGDDDIPMDPPSKPAKAKKVEKQLDPEEATQTGPVSQDDLPDLDNLNEALSKLMKKSNVSADQVLVFCKEKKMAGESVEDVFSLSDDKLKKLVLNWKSIENEIGSIEM